ncbi:fimbrial protein [Escherichia coli]|nr:fimbrial protein [Escherichia coli]
MVAKINLLSRLTPLLFVFAPFFAQSNMTVYPMAVSINSQGEGNVRVISKSNEVQYIKATGNDSNLLIVFYVQIMPDDFVMQLHRF